MRKQLVTILLCAVVQMLIQAAPPAATVAPSQAELDKVISAAATYESGQSYEPFRQLEDWVRLSTSNAILREQLETGLIKLLAPTSTLEARRFACKQLGIIGTASALPALSELLSKPETAGFACLALTTYPRGKADEVLRAALQYARGSARLQIINTLGDRRDPQSVPLLMSTVRYTDQAAAEAAIAALGKIGTADARKAIADLRPDAAPALQPALVEATLRCAETLAVSKDRIGAEALYEPLLAPEQPAQVRRSAFIALLRLEPNLAGHRILEVLNRADGALIPAAIAAIPSLPGEIGSEPFVRELPLLQPQEQVLMLHSLATRGDYAAVSAISKSVESSDSAIRRAAIAALGRAGDLTAVPVLTLALRERKDPADLRAVESALGELGGGSATDQAIIDELSRSSGAPRVHLLTAIAKRLGRRANPLLVREADSPYPRVAVAALRALGKTAGARDVPALLAKLVEEHDPDVSAEAESAAAQALSRIPDAARRSAMVREALDRALTVESRRSLLALLPGCGDAAALASLQAAAVSTEPPIQDAAIRALADWPDLTAWDALASALRQAKSDALRSVALHGLVRLAGEANAHPDAALVARYHALLEAAKTDAEVKLILGALAGDADPGALELAQSLVEREGVRAEAKVAVKKISEALKQKRPQVEEEAAPKAPAKQ